MPPYQCPQCGQYTVSRSEKRIVGRYANGPLCETRFTQRACEKCGWASMPSAPSLLALRREARAGRITLLAEYAASP